LLRHQAKALPAPEREKKNRKGKKEERAAIRPLADTARRYLLGKAGCKGKKTSKGGGGGGGGGGGELWEWRGLGGWKVVGKLKVGGEGGGLEFEEEKWEESGGTKCVKNRPLSSVRAARKEKS